MSHSKRAKDRRRKRSKLNKTERSKMVSQHFGDKFTYKGRPLMRGQDKKELMEQDKQSEKEGLDGYMKRFLANRFGD
jgi:hypothetical protein